MARTCFTRRDEKIRFVLDQHAELVLNCARSLKQHTADRHIAPLGHIIRTPRQPVLTRFRPELTIYHMRAH